MLDSASNSFQRAVVIAPTPNPCPPFVTHSLSLRKPVWLGVALNAPSAQLLLHSSQSAIQSSSTAALPLASVLYREPLNSQCFGIGYVVRLPSVRNVANVYLSSLPTLQLEFLFDGGGTEIPSINPLIVYTPNHLHHFHLHLHLHLCRTFSHS